MARDLTIDPVVVRWCEITRQYRCRVKIGARDCKGNEICLGDTVSLWGENESVQIFQGKLYPSVISMLRADFLEVIESPGIVCKVQERNQE